MLPPYGSLFQTWVSFLCDLGKKEVWRLVFPVFNRFQVLFCGRKRTQISTDEGGFKLSMRKGSCSEIFIYLGEMRTDQW